MAEIYRLLDRPSPEIESLISGHQTLRHLLHSSSLDFPNIVALEEKLLGEDVPPLPPVPSGLVGNFDSLHEGGFRGVVVWAGPGGAGKSIEGVSFAMTNAFVDGTVAFYLDAENFIGEQGFRAKSWFPSDRDFRSRMPTINGLHFHWIEVLPGMGWQQLLRHCAERVLPDHERAVLVLDSVQSIARMIRGKPLETQSRIYIEANSLMRRSGGRIVVLALSELNSEGRVYGLDGAYAGTQVFKLRLEPDQGENIVSILTEKNRVGRKLPDLGHYYISRERCRLIQRGAQP